MATRKRKVWTPEIDAYLLTLKGTSPDIATSLAKKFGKPFTPGAVRAHLSELQHTPESAETVKPARTATANDMYKLLKDADVSLELRDVASRLDISRTKAEDLIKQLQREGYNVRVEGNRIAMLNSLPIGQRIKVDPETLWNGELFQVGLISDPHYGSRYTREDVMKTAYDTFAEYGIKEVFNCGNIIDGFSRRINVGELKPGLEGLTAQVQYLIENYPHREGITTKFITGDCHEGWWMKDTGLNIGGYIQLEANDAGRTDLQWIGHIEVDVQIGDGAKVSYIKLMHPGGGTAYAKSYSHQKIIESFTGGEKPAILFLGHFHKSIQDYVRNCHVFQAGCAQDQTPFMRKRKLAAEVGFWIIQFHQAKTGEINRCRGEWFPFFDKGFYTKNDKYRKW